MASSRRAGIMWAITLLLAGGALYAACHHVDWRALGHTIRGTRVDLLLLVVAMAVVALGLRGLRWRILIVTQPPASARMVCWAAAVGYLANSYLPARAGEFIRASVLGKRLGVSTSYILATALTERLFDVVALAIIAALALLTQHTLPNWLHAATRVMILTALAGICLLCLTVWSQQVTLRLLAYLPLPEAAHTRLRQIVTQFILGVSSVHHLARGSAFIAMTAVIWLLDGAGVVVLAWALAIRLTLSQALLFNAALGMASIVPSTPGGLGIFQFTAVTILAPFRVPSSAALAFILVSQMITYLVYTICGGLGLWQLGLSWRLTAHTRTDDLRESAAAPMSMEKVSE